jgi:aspartate-semialdehyde dehydrogenase
LIIILGVNEMSNKLKVGIVGGTGMVGQRFVTLLDNHPYFEVVSIAASEKSAGRSYAESVEGRWKLNAPIPDSVKNIVVKNASNVSDVASEVDFVFCAVDMKKDEIKALEEAYAKAETPVVSNNSAHRWTPDVPMVIPEINDSHLEILSSQQKRLGVKNGFIAVKPNCSIQSYVPALHALKDFGINKVTACTYQAISGAGKTFTDWPEMIDNVIPYIGGEEEKSEQEPLKIWGSIVGNEIVKAASPVITTQCIRVPASDGHMAAVFVSFDKKPSKEEIIARLESYQGKPQTLALPSAPKQFLKYMTEDNRPQTKLDRDYENGMGITVGRVREDIMFDYKFVCLSHNTVRGAAGGAVLIAELLKAEGYLKAK